MADVPLEAIEGWSPDHVARMKVAWITTAEQVVALGATEGGILSISEQLKVSNAEANRLVELARKSLTPDVRAEMDKPADTSNYGLGVIKPTSEDR